MANPLLTIARRGLGGLFAAGNYLTLPKPIKRDDASQQAIDKRAATLALYHFPLCPFCIKTRRHLHRLAVPVQTRNASPSGDPEHRNTLEKDGGKIQVPCLRIKHSDGSNEWLYESSAIIAWLEAEFGDSQAAA